MQWTVSAAVLYGIGYLSVGVGAIQIQQTAPIEITDRAPHSLNPLLGASSYLESRDLPIGTCNANTPCANKACCSKDGLCGYSPKFCGDGCRFNCDAKAQCGQYAPSGQQRCPLNVCCSQFGYCGSTAEFCGKGCDTQWGGCGDPNRPSCGAGSSVSKRTIGYYESWSNTRKCQNVSPEDLNLNGFTHINYAFSFFDPTTFQISPMDSNGGSLYSRFTGLKSKHKGLQTWISVGGWSFTDPGPYRSAFSDMASSSGNRQTFISGLIKFMDSYGFDGVDIDWEYPVADDRGGKSGDSANYVLLVQELKAAFGSKYGVTVTLPTSYWYLQHFDLKAMLDHVDWFNLMAYDLHGIWDKESKFVGPYIAPHTNITEIDLGLDLLWRAGVTPDKVVMGQGWYGRSFTLKDPSCNTPNGVCEFTGGAKAGPCSDASGILDNQEIQDIIKKNNLKPVHDEKTGVNWITWDSDQWVSFDDDTTFKQKRDFANKRCLGGLMVWAIDQVDQSAANGLGPAPGVTNSQQSDANQMAADQQAGVTCYSTACGDKCKKGTNPVTQMSGQPGQISTSDRCPKGKYETLCCDDGTIMGVCKWRGFKGVGLPCTSGCADGETKVVENTNHHDKKEDQTCTGGLQSYCCKGFKPAPSKAQLKKDAADAAKAAAEQAAENAALDIAAKAFCRIAVPALLVPLELAEDFIPIVGEILDAIEIAATPAIIEGCVKGIEKGGKAEFKVFGKKHTLSMDKPDKPTVSRAPPKETNKPKTTDKPAKTTEKKTTTHTSTHTSSSTSAAATICSQDGKGACSGSTCSSKKPPRSLLGKLTLRSAGTRLLSYLESRGLYKRVMPSPQSLSPNLAVGDTTNWRQIMDTFMINLFNSPRTTLVTHAPAGQPPSSAAWEIWAQHGGNDVNVGVMGLYGCTSLIVVSKRGVYMTHYFEGPSFIGTRANFDLQVLDTLTTATPLCPSLAFMTTGIAGMRAFDAADDPQALIVSVGTNSITRNVGTFAYPALVSALEARVKTILPPGSKVTKYDYTRASDLLPPSRYGDVNSVQFQNFMRTSAFGRVITQYSATGSATGGPAYKVYVENQPNPIIEAAW